MNDLIPPEFKTAESLRTLANYLRSQNGVKVRSGIEHEKRVDYFKGKRLVECILEGKKWPKSLPKITDSSVAQMVANSMIQAAFFHRSEKVEGKKGFLRISQKNVFEPQGYYTWIYAGNMVWSNIATGAVIAVVIGFTLLPVWPEIAKKVLWYFSVTFLIATLAFSLLRFLLFLFSWLLGYEFWVFPRLFDESLSFQDSFKPVYSFEKAAAGQGYYRIAVVVAIGAFVYWACTQPTEFDGFLKAQRDFIDDIYSGNLLADVAHDHREHIDRSRRIPNIEDLLREMAEEERIEATAHNAQFETEKSDDKEMEGGEERVGAADGNVRDGDSVGEGGDGEKSSNDLEDNFFDDMLEKAEVEID